MKRKRSYSAKSRADGFTITEVLIAVFVLAIGLIGVISVFPVGIQATQKTLDNSAAAVAVNTALAAVQYQLDTSDQTPIDAFASGSATVTIAVFPDFGSPGLDSYPILNVYEENGSSPPSLDLIAERYHWNTVLSKADTVAGTLTGRSLVRVQIAVFDNDPSTNAWSGANFTKDAVTVTFTTLPGNLKEGFYIRRTDGGSKASRWYRIRDVDASNKRIHLVSPYAEDAASNASILITPRVYETYLSAP